MVHVVSAGLGQDMNEFASDKLSKMIKVDENDPVGELQPSFPYRDVTIKRNVDVNEYYELESEIGRGKFGTVYRCKEKSTGLTLAAKFVGIARRQDRRNVEREVEIMRTLQHPRLIQLYDAFEANSVMCVIQELIEGGELFERVIDDDFILTEKACTVFMRQICEGVEFIHSQNIIHLDLKPENILCLTRTGNRIKIIDFGLARKFEPDKKLQVLFGTPEFVAPEVVNFEQIGFGTDMWSVGVICYVLLSGLSPFMGETDVETMANVTIAQYDFDDEAFDDISEDAKDFISKLLTKSKEQRLTASECLSHVWLRRKPPPPPPPQLIQPKQRIELIPQPAPEILDNTKENLREFVDRWNEQGVTSPSKVIVSPSSVPFKEINDENIKSPQIVSDINKNLIKDDGKIVPDSSITRMDVDKNVPVNNDQQNLTDRTITNVNKNDQVTTDATQIECENEIPGKKIKLDDTLNTTVVSDVQKSFVNNIVPSVTKLPPENETGSNNLNKDLNFLPPLTIPQPSCTSSNIVNVVSRTPSDQNVNFNASNKTNNSLPSPMKSQPSSPIGTVPKTPSGSNLKFNESNDKSRKQELLSPHLVKKQLPAEITDNRMPIKTPSSDKINKVVSDNTREIELNIMKQPHTAKSLDNSSSNVTNNSQFNNVLHQDPEKLPVTPKETNADKNSGSVAGSKLIETTHKSPSGISVIDRKSNETIHKPIEFIHKPNESIHKPIETIHKPIETIHKPIETIHKPIEFVHKPNESIQKPSETIHKPPHIPNVVGSKSNETVHKPHVPNVIGSNSNEAVHKPPFLPNLGGSQRPKLLPQFSVPNDLSKCSLNKNVPVSSSLLKEGIVKKSGNENVIAKTDSRSNISYSDSKELTTTDGKFNKTLNKHVIPPKIHGIVLGQNDNQDNNNSSKLPEKMGPKVITHKIFVEGRTDPILPPAVPSSVNKENKKNENRVQKPISKSQTSSKLELKENSGFKNKPINSRFFDNDRFDRRGSDISCFLHNTENLERMNLAEEIKKLSSRLFQMGNNTTDEQENNSNNNNSSAVSNPIPISSYKNDPIGRFLANHGLVTRRPKYRMSNLNRDVPIGSPPPASNLFYHLSHSNSDTWSDNQTHSAPQSPSASPERETGRLTKEVILRLFDKNNPDNNTSPPKEVEEKHPAMSSIDSLASYFKTNNETKKNNVPPTVTSK